MKTLFLLRHAKSSWKDESQSDFDRPLNERGKNDAPLVGDHLRSIGILPELVLSSSAQRARKTAQKLIAALGQNIELRLIDALYLAVSTTYVEHLRSLSDEFVRVLVVGHNPGLEELLAELTGHYERMATAALAQIELPIETWGELTPRGPARLVSLWRPSEQGE